MNGRQIRAKIDTLLPSPAHTAQGQQARQATKSQTVSNVVKQYTVGTPCYALYCGPRRDKDPRWVPATVTKVHGSRSVNVRVHPRGAIGRRHLEQLRPRYGTEHDNDPGEDFVDLSSTEQPRVQSPGPVVTQRRNPRMPQGDEYGPHNPRRSQRARKPRQL